ncbi:hypothetical protein HPA88_06010 [Streptococcus suis]|uniref:Uncharacterized protein n=1 Tax=Streptococcus suis TaxID=1307 RepID=A0AB33U971_STRSU|nr:hypothetical protein [Streptococcus suis]MCK3947969.1 hypothetical protein [Streptococcus suis]MCK3963413.1 hypothetical protein [Streptococcus suis]MCK3991048.1 hypothetical protein [Streptococcus suis]MDE1695346.1 hypothetical protein [Streptococcus suis]MEE3814233.1 hypothetical protein [Streptococcus suis]
MSEIKNRVSEILSKDGMIKNIMFECVRELDNFDSEQQIEFLELLFTNFGKFEIDKEVQSGDFVTEEQTEAYFSSSLDKFVVGIYQAILKRAIKNNFPVTTFYREIHELILSSKLLIEDYQKALALTQLTQQKEMPYLNVDFSVLQVIKDFSEFNQENPDLVEIFDYIFRLNLEYKTEYSSLLLNELEKFSTKEDRVICLAKMLDVHKFLIEKEFEQAEE